MTSKRQRARTARRNRALEQRLAEATTPAARTAVEWDQTRSDINRLPVRDRDTAWTALTGHLAEFRTRIAAFDNGEPTAEVHNFTSHRGRGVFGIQRPAARGRAGA